MCKVRGLCGKCTVGKDYCCKQKVQASTVEKESKQHSSWPWKLTAPHDEREKWNRTWAFLWQCHRSHKLGFEKALKKKTKTKKIFQGFLFSEVPICCVNDSTCFPLGEWKHSKGGWSSWTHWLKFYLLRSLPQRGLPSMWHKPFSGQKRDNFYVLLKFLTLPAPRPSLPARLDAHTVRPGWVCIAVISFIAWNSVLQIQLGSHKSSSLGGREAVHTTSQWRWTTHCIGITCTV